ncbi:hypothetical protein D3C76_1351390 [compost metagenome]
MRDHLTTHGHAFDKAAQRRHAKHASQYSADHAADAVQAEHIEAVVIAKTLFDHRNAQVAKHAAQQAGCQCSTDTDVSTRRRNADQTGQGTTG